MLKVLRTHPINATNLQPCSRRCYIRNPATKFILLTPALLLVALTTTYPLIYALVSSFRSWSLRRPDDQAWIGLENYRRAFVDIGFVNSVIVTFNFTVLSVALSVIIGLAIALVLQKPSRLNTITKTLLIFPFAVSPALKGYSFRFMLNDTYGVLDAIVDPIVRLFGTVLTLGGLITYPDVRIAWQTARYDLIPTLTLPITTDTVWLGEEFWALFWIAMSEVWGWAPLIALMFLGALGSISPEIYNAAKIDGATNWTLFWFITLPLLRPVILIVTLLKTIFSLKMFDQVVTMTGGGPGRATQTINYYIYQVGFGRSLNMGYASALSYLLVVVLSILAFLYVKALLQRSA